MATTMKDLFDDSSSDDDDFDPNKKEEPAAAPDAASPGAVRRVIHEEDDDDESSDEPTKKQSSTETKETDGEEKQEVAKPSASSEATETPAAAAQAETSTGNLDTAKKTINDDDDDDDEDVEFNDDGVIGSSAPARTTQANTESTDATAAASATKRPANKKPRHIQVLESDRPPAGTSLYITKLPNLVGIQTEPFDPETYSASLEEQDYRGYVHSMIRWRYAKDEQGEFKRDDDGKLIRESNARLVAWDDGNGGPKSYTLHVGNEVFEVDANDSSSNGFAGLNGYLYLSQKATFPDEDHTPAGTVLESMGAIQSRLVARPSSLQSQAHKKHTVAVRQKTIKKARIAEYVTQEDPEKAKQDRIKIKQDLEKASARKRQSSGYRRPAMNRRYLEQDDGNYDSVNIKDLKRRGRDLDDEDMDYGEDSEEEEEDDSMFNRRRSKRASRQQQEDDDEEDELVFDEESDDDEQVIKATSRKKLQHQALLDDDDE